MRLIVQRVNKASVSVENKVVGRIGKGLFVLVGVKVIQLPPQKLQEWE